MIMDNFWQKVPVHHEKMSEASIFWWKLLMMTSSNRNVFQVTGPLWENRPVTGRFLTKVSDPELWCCLWSAPEQTIKQTIETPVLTDAISPNMTSLMFFYWLNQWSKVPPYIFSINSQIGKLANCTNWHSMALVSTVRPRQNGRQFFRRHFLMDFLEWKCMNFASNLFEVCSSGPNEQYHSLCPGNGFAPK